MAGRLETAMAEAAGGPTGGGGGGGGGSAARSGGEDSPSSSSPSPKNRLKFLCSYGGRILPRPSDVHFKYVGGDTRVLVVPRSVSFHELKKMIQGMFGAEVVIKYQLAAVDLDVLITVAGDDDLAYMIEEYDRLDALHPNSPSCSSSPRFRLFIFPSSAAAAAAPLHPDAASTLDQPSYIADAGSSKRSIFTISSARTSPTSSVDEVGALLGKPSVGIGGGMQRVRSTPNLGGYGSRSGGSLVSLVPPGIGPKGAGGMNQYQQQHQLHHQHLHPHVHWQHSPGGVTGRQQGTAPGGGSPWRMPGPPVRYDVCGCQMAMPQPPRGGGHHYAPAYSAGHGGYACYGHAEEPSQSTGRVGHQRSSPMSNGAPGSPSAGAAMRRPSTWDELQQ